MRYYVNDAGGWMSVSGDSALFQVPEGWTEITEEEFRERLGVTVQDDAHEPVSAPSQVQAEQAAAGQQTAAAPKVTAKSRTKAR